MRYVFTILRNCLEKRSACCPLAVVIQVNRLRMVSLVIHSVLLSSAMPELAWQRDEIPVSSKNRHKSTRVMAMERSRVSRDELVALMDIGVFRMSFLRAKEMILGRIPVTMT